MYRPTVATISRYDVSRKMFSEMLEGEPKYRVEQVWTGLYKDLRDPEGITNISKTLRATIEELLPRALVPVRESVSRDRGTRKFL